MAVDRPADTDEFRKDLCALVRRRLGGEVVRFEPIAPGLGTRVFSRLHLAGCSVASAIARIEVPEDPAGRPTGVAPEPSLEPLRSFLEQAQLPVPRSYGREGPIQLLEDGGRCSLEDAAQRASRDARRAPDSVHSRQELYAEALRLVPRLQRLSASGKEIPAFGRHLDASLFAYKAGLFAEWALPFALGRSPVESEALAVREAFAWIADECAKAPARLSHRDFKAANLLVQEAGQISRGAPRLMLIDLQGAFMAPPEYDLVCLLRDSHVALPEDEVQGHLSRIRTALPDAPDPASFERRFTLLTLTRVGKDLARYLYAAATRNDRRYLPLVPRSVAMLRTASSIAAPWDRRLARLADLIQRFPSGTPEPRTDPSCEP